ncbi:hypothetical protein DEO72_LG6g398 [Vigna unguiculata]|uniref:Uncharacterized protein n=1 Tax=Vigna unguiculata TaxID=3917 RepID=A0A4D6M4L0_VIGUN|nr:hypothetical protein DEO72_LG6g398 [Vigna unguiculata]
MKFTASTSLHPQNVNSLCSPSSIHSCFFSSFCVVPLVLQPFILCILQPFILCSASALHSLQCGPSYLCSFVVVPGGSFFEGSSSK